LLKLILIKQFQQAASVLYEAVGPGVVVPRVTSRLPLKLLER